MADEKYFPLSSQELDELKADVSRYRRELEFFTPETVGRLLATIEWYQRRDADIATRLGNSQVELDELFSAEAIETLDVLGPDDTVIDRLEVAGG